MEVTVNYGYRGEDVASAVDVERLARFVIASENAPSECEVSINFVQDDEIRALNRDFRGIDRVTDVLSFECDGIALEEEPASAGDSVFELGDIVLAPDVAERQAPEYGMTFCDEVSLLLVHGLLHLCGYDHVDDDDAARMEQREAELLSQFYDREFKRSHVEG